MEACGLWFRYRNAPSYALRGCDLRVPTGCRLALLGANGSGKTTLLLHLDGILRPERGTVRLDGVPQAHDRRSLRRWRRSVGLVVQHPDDMLLAGTVLQEVAFGPLNLGAGERDAVVAVERILDELSLTHLRDRPIHLLSGGERHRVAIAAVAVTEPSVLLLDEPTAGLDPAAVGEVLDVLDRLHARGTTIVLSTHDVDLAHRWADTVAVMVDGTVGGSGGPEILGDRALLGAARLRPPAVVRIWQSLPETLRPTACPPDIDALALFLTRARFRDQPVGSG
jgi:cobalt/nickel transport system ATP-binding protein